MCLEKTGNEPTSQFTRDKLLDEPRFSHIYVNITFCHSFNGKVIIQLINVVYIMISYISSFALWYFL